MQCSKTSILLSDSSRSFLCTRPWGAPLESLAHLMIADPIADAFRTVANITGDLMLVALFDRLRSLPEPVDGVTIVPRAEAFGGAVQDLAQHIPGTVPIIDPYES